MGLKLDALSTNFEVDHVEVFNQGFAGIIGRSPIMLDVFRLVETVCRAGLTARRLECRIEVVGATPELRRLLEALGLAGVLPCADDPHGVGGASGVEAEG